MDAHTTNDALFDPDERRATWKLLLPWDRMQPVLALGVASHVERSLRRSYETVVCGGDEMAAAEVKRYPICVCDASGVDRFAEQLSASRAAGAVTAIVGELGRRVARAGRPCDPERVACRWGGVPAGQPRIFLDLASRWTRRAGLTMHSAGSWRARAKVGVARLLSEVGISAHMGRFGVALGAPAGYVPDLVRRTEAVVGEGIATCALYSGSVDPKRKMTVAMTSTSGRAIVAKIADSDAGAAAINRETAVLRGLAAGAVRQWVPRVLGTEACGAYLCQWQSGLPEEGRWRLRSQLTAAHSDFLARLRGDKTALLPLCEVPLYQRVGALRERRRCAHEPSPVPGGLDYGDRHACEQALDYLDRHAAASIECGPAHGDFTPWNMRYGFVGGRAELFVFDWEDAEDSMPVGTDLIQFIYRQRRLVGPWKGWTDVLDAYRAFVGGEAWYEAAAQLFIAQECLR